MGSLCYLWLVAPPDHQNKKRVKGYFFKDLFSYKTYYHVISWWIIYSSLFQIKKKNHFLCSFVCRCILCSLDFDIVALKAMSAFYMWFIMGCVEVMCPTMGQMKQYSLASKILHHEHNCFMSEIFPRSHSQSGKILSVSDPHLPRQAAERPVCLHQDCKPSSGEFSFPGWSQTSTATTSAGKLLNDV